LKAFIGVVENILSVWKKGGTSNGRRLSPYPDLLPSKKYGDRYLEKEYGPIKRLWYPQSGPYPRIVLTQSAKGVNRYILDTAIKAGLAYSGWCGPKPGDLVPGRYPLFSVNKSKQQITKLNIRHADGVLIIAQDINSNDAISYRNWCQQGKRPFISATPNTPVAEIQKWLTKNKINVLFVAPSSRLNYRVVKPLIRDLLSTV
jgi:hypothetical protein